jgi:hypothetical protein
VLDTARVVPFRGETVSGVPATGRVREVEVIGPNGLHLIVGDVTWDTGEREVRVLRRRRGPPGELGEFVDRARMPVEEHGPGHVVISLRQARRDGQERVTLCPATEAQLDAGAGVPVRSLLGARFRLAGWGTLESILGEPECSPGTLCAVFPADVRLAPVATFLLTLVVPAARHYDGGRPHPREHAPA